MHYRLVLGNRVYSGWSLRSWLSFRHFGIDFDHEVVPLYTAAFEAFREDCFPARKLPTLIATEGQRQWVIWDSLAIAEFLCDRHADIAFWPSDPEMRATARSLCAEVHSGFTALRAKMPVNLRRRYSTFTPDDATHADIQRVCELWRWTLSTFECGGPYLFGRDFTVADAFFAPIATRFRTYAIALDDQSEAYGDALLRHPAVVEFTQAAQSETWTMQHNEFDRD